MAQTMDASVAFHNETALSATRRNAILCLSFTSSNTAITSISLSALSQQSRALSEHWLGFVSGES